MLIKALIALAGLGVLGFIIYSLLKRILRRIAYNRELNNQEPEFHRTQDEGILMSAYVTIPDKRQTL